MNSKKFDAFIVNYINDNIKNSVMREMYLYSLNSGGKRFRPSLFLNLFNSDEIDENLYLVALAIEFTHTYSLIHDDLPSMDNDLFRRGKKSLWNEYNDSNALLIGDSLISEAYKAITLTTFSSDTIVKLISSLIDKSGSNGMILGQFLDINNFTDTKENIDYMYYKKTSEMLTLCFNLYAIIKGIDPNRFETLGKYLGIMYQYQDDYLEIYSLDNEKNDADVRNEKNTSITLLKNYKDEIISLKKIILSEIKELKISESSIKILELIIKRDENV